LILAWRTISDQGIGLPCNRMQGRRNTRLRNFVLTTFRGEGVSQKRKTLPDGRGNLAGQIACGYSGNRTCYFQSETLRVLPAELTVLQTEAMRPGVGFFPCCANDETAVGPWLDVCKREKEGELSA
jgi:hypothetical protein